MGFSSVIDLTTFSLINKPNESLLSPTDYVALLPKSHPYIIFNRHRQRDLSVLESPSKIQ